jgi:hypothetical protein
MNKTDPEPSGTFHGGPGDVPTGTVLPSGTAEQGSPVRRHPRRRGMRMLAAAGAAAVVLAAGVMTALHVGSAAAPSPLSAVTSALARTSAQSYAFSLNSTVQFAGKDLNSDVVSGAFDPGHHLGTELLTAHSAGRTTLAQVRFIGADLYTWASPRSGFGKPWDKSLSAAAEDVMPPGDLYGFISDQPVSPDKLAVVLRSAGAAVHDAGAVSGPGWAGIKYTFTARIYEGRESVSGAVDVDEQGRVRRLMTITTDTAIPRYATKATGPTTDRDITFGDFGTPVRASVPPASQVKYTSGAPYWGFYF